MEDLQETNSPLIIRASRGERLRKSIAARLRRRNVKLTKTVKSFKREKEAKERVRAKRRLLRQKRFRNNQKSA
jgi:hypothetical protein